QILQRVLTLAVVDDFEVQVDARAVAGAAYLPKRLACTYFLTGFHGQRVEVGVNGTNTVGAVDNDEAAVGAAGVATGPDDAAGVGGGDIALPLADIDSQWVGGTISARYGAIRGPDEARRRASAAKARTILLKETRHAFGERIG